MEKGYTINVLDHGFVRYIDHLGSDERICEAARISYRSPSKGPEQDKKLIAYLWKNKHTSPFEMGKITFNIKLPIFVMRQYVRHRMQNLNEVSARYTELPNEFYIPSVWRKQDTKNKQGSITADWDEGDHYTMSADLHAHCQQSYEFYEKLLKLGVAREMARMVLPINVYTEIYTTWDINNLLKFVVLRDDSHAQYEIQEYGKAMKAIAKELFPFTLEAYEKFKFTVKDETMKPIWIIQATSESGDDYGPKRYDHEPTEEEKKNFVIDTGEELNIDGPGDFGSYVYLKVHKL